MKVNFKNIKGYIIGTIFGVILATSLSAYAAVGDKVEAMFASFNLIVNGQVKTMQTSPLVYNGTSYLPVRDIANLVGYDVTYKSDSRTIELNNGTSVTGGVYSSVPSQAVVVPSPSPVSTTVTSTPTPMSTSTPVPNSTSTAIETTYNGMKAIMLNGVTYYSEHDYEMKFLTQEDQDNTWIKVNDNTHTVAFKRKGKEYLISLSSSQDIQIYNGGGYLNIKFIQ